MKKPELFLLFFLPFLALGLFVSTRRDTISTATVQELPTVSGFILRLYDDYVAVFDASRPNIPLRLTEIHASSLRHYDRELLAHGIPLATEEEVLMRLEDFGS